MESTTVEIDMVDDEPRVPKRFEWIVGMGSVCTTASMGVAGLSLVLAISVSGSGSVWISA